ncbi:Quino protein alcohol dehydrogenase-like protein [Thozetella sp. PMI_491]|nr:Quino protein alcohol dehydrogenase-like protein [Thozetella sp. PMI_491]
MRPISGTGALGLLLAVNSALSNPNPAPDHGDSWSGWGGSSLNNRWASANTDIFSSNVASLSSHCKISYGPGGVSATPVVNGNFVYFPTWSGLFVALDYVRCRVAWQLDVIDIITDFAPVTALQATILANVSRTSPQVDLANGALYFATQVHALAVAVDLASGNVLATAQVNAHPLAMVTTSPTLHKGLVLFGAASLEEAITLFVPEYPCCTFVGNVAALEFKRTGPMAGRFRTVWSTSTLPASPEGTLPNNSWAGASVWGSQPSIDAARSQVFVGTGNAFAAPAEYVECKERTQSISSNGTQGDLCLPPNAWQESILALDLATGRPNWARQLHSLDDWTAACGLPGQFPTDYTLCPQGPGPDADFGMAPAFVPASPSSFGLPVDAVVAGQKSGMLWALSAADGSLLWSTATSPGGNGGGLSWGVAVDADQVYFTAINSEGVEWTPVGASGAINNSAWGAASLATGDVVWSAPASESDTSFTPPTVVSDVVLVGRSGTGPSSLVALRKGTGELLMEWPLDQILRGGIAVQGKWVLLGTGYSRGQNGSLWVMRVD